MIAAIALASLLGPVFAAYAPPKPMPDIIEFNVPTIIDPCVEQASNVLKCKLARSIYSPDYALERDYGYYKYPDEQTQPNPYWTDERVDKYDIESAKEARALTQSSYRDTRDFQYLQIHNGEHGAIDAYTGEVMPDTDEDDVRRPILTKTDVDRIANAVVAKLRKSGIK